MTIQGRLWVVAAVTVLLVACGDAGETEAQADETREQPYLAGPEDVARASLGRLLTGATISGELTSDQTAAVRAQIPGEIADVRADVGDRVSQGQVVARIRAMSEREEVASAKAAVETAQTELTIAERDESRTLTLVEAGALARRDYERALAATANARARLAQAKAALAVASERVLDAVARAPIDGVIRSIPISRGDVVAVGAELFTIVDLSNMQLEASVPSDSIGSVEVGTPVQFQVQGYGDRIFSGSITRISPAVDPGTNQVRVYVAIPNEERTLVSGLYAEGRLATGEQQAILVPANAVSSEGDEAYVMVVDDGTARRRPVEIGGRDEQTGTVQITSGVEAGAIVFTGAAREVRDGAPVEVRGSAESVPPQVGLRGPSPGADLTQAEDSDGQGSERSESPSSFAPQTGDTQQSTPASRPRRSEKRGRLSGQIGGEESPSEAVTQPPGRPATPGQGN